MSAPETRARPRLALWAAEPAGPRPLPVPERASGLHDALFGLPEGVYSGLRTFHHVRYLALEDHLERTRRSLALTGRPDDVDWDALRRTLHHAADAAPWGDSRVRFDVLFEPPRALGTDGRVLVLLEPHVPVPEAYLREGVRVELTDALARDNPRAKTSEFILRRRPFPLGEQRRYEHVMLDEDGRLLEGTSSNFFAVEGGELRTAGPGVLEGITRKLFLRLAREEGIPVRLEAVAQGELGDLSEAFLTSSSRGLVPVVDVAGTRVGDGRPGPVGERLSAAYAELAEREARPAIPEVGAGGGAAL